MGLLLVRKVEGWKLGGFVIDWFADLLVGLLIC